MRLALLLVVYASSVFAVPYDLPSGRTYQDVYRYCSDAGRADEIEQRVFWDEDIQKVQWRPWNLSYPTAAQCDYTASPTNSVDWWAHYVRTYSPPVEFPHGIAVPDIGSPSNSPTWAVGVQGGSIVVWQDRASPRDKEAAASNRAVAAHSHKQIRKDLKVLKGVAQTNKAQVQAIVAWTNGMTAGQQRSDINDIRRELIDANDTIIELIRLNRALLKESD